MKKILSLLILLSIFTAQADEIVFYKQNFVVKRTGGGTVIRTRLKGWTLVSTGAETIVKADPARLQFTVEQPTFYHGAVAAERGKVSSVFVIGSGELAGWTAKGVAKTNALFTGIAPTIILRITGSQLFTANAETHNPPYSFAQYSGFLVFDKSRTQSAKTENLDLAQCIQRLRDLLVAKGYTEEQHHALGVPDI